MAISDEILETFFEARFQFMDQSLSELRELRHFDGFVHWEVYWDAPSGLLRIAADKEPFPVPYPTLEIEGVFADVSIYPLTGGAIAMVLHPKGVQDKRNYLVITKTTKGRLSLATSLGQPGQDVDRAG